MFKNKVNLKEVFNVISINIFIAAFIFNTLAVFLFYCQIKNLDKKFDFYISEVETIKRDIIFNNKMVICEIKAQQALDSVPKSSTTNWENLKQAFKGNGKID